MNDSRALATQDAGENKPRRRGPGRFALVRAVLLFQFKLFIDGLKDIVLSPVSMVAAGLDLLFGGGSQPPGRLFRGVLGVGRRFDDWIDLFRASELPEVDAEEGSSSGLDDQLDRLEKLLREKHERGELTAGVRDAVDRSLGAMRAAVQTAQGGPSESARPQ